MVFSRMSNSLRLIPDERFGWPAQVGVLSVPVAETQLTLSILLGHSHGSKSSM